MAEQTMATKRPLVVELIGPWGAGKGTLLAALGAHGRSVRTDLDVWHLPKPLLLRGGLEALSTVVGLFRAAKSLLWFEGKQLVKLCAIHRQLADPRLSEHEVLVLDEGPLLAMSWLHLGGHPAISNGGLESWWPGALRQWADALDLVVFLDAPNAVLAKRIRERPRYHPLRDRSDAEMFTSLDRYRSACARVLHDLARHGGPRVLTVRSDETSASEISREVLAAVARIRHGD
jgi:hypothetical protein